jgi:hypothetical protein
VIGTGIVTAKLVRNRSKICFAHDEEKTTSSTNVSGKTGYLPAGN